VEYPRGEVVEFSEGFRSVEDAIEWALSRTGAALVRLGFGTEDEYGVGEVMGWDGKMWPPSDDERREIEARVRSSLGIRLDPSKDIEVEEPEIRRIPEGR
jgi:hypothetical protein